MNSDADLIKFGTMCGVTIDFTSNSGLVILFVVKLWNTICRLGTEILASPKKFSIKSHAGRNLLAIQIIFKGLNNCFGGKFMTSNVIKFKPSRIGFSVKKHSLLLSNLLYIQ